MPSYEPSSEVTVLRVVLLEYCATVCITEITREASNVRVSTPAELKDAIADTWPRLNALAAVKLNVSEPLSSFLVMVPFKVIFLNLRVKLALESMVRTALLRPNFL